MRVAWEVAHGERAGEGCLLEIWWWSVNADRAQSGSEEAVASRSVGEIVVRRR